MDPLSALSLAATLVQLVDFTSKIVSKGYHIYNATNGALAENVALEYIVTDLQNLNDRLKHHDKLSCATKDEQALEDLSTHCTGLANELIERLTKLKVASDTNRRRWKSFRQALKSVWNKEELDAMASKLAEYRNQLEFHILLSLKEKNDLLEVQLSDHFDRLDEATKVIIRMLQQNQTPFANELKAQNIIIAQFHHENKLHVSREHEKTRMEIIKALNASQTYQRESIEMASTSATAAIPITKKNAFSRSILDSLKFPSMYDRYDGIDDAYKKTFDWIFRPDSHSQLWSNFFDWLVNGENIYWISGKAGSGKSTLMRFIYEDARTMSLLGQWAGSPKNLTTAGFFFWKSGTVDQSSQTGLLRSLLYMILYKHQTHTLTVFPEEWKEFCDQVNDKPASTSLRTLEYRWNLKKLKIGLQRLFQIDLGRVCLFVDGLDEYSGDHSDTVNLFKSIISTNIKICISSRPWVEFQEAFKSLPGLKLQDLTFGDISLYVDGKLAQNKKMMAFRNQEPAKGAYFVKEIVTRADGVFLWVKLVVKSLLDGLDYEDSIADFDRRLHELPSDLEDLYTFMFNSINSRYFMERAQIFQIMRAANNWRPKGEITRAELRLCALTLSFAIEDTEESALSLPTRPISSTEVTKRVERVDKRLKVCCAGLLELLENSPVNKSEPEEDGPILERLGNVRIKYLHRTAKDFLDSDSILAKFQQGTEGTGFSVWSFLLKSFLLRLKTCESQKHDRIEFESVLEMPMEIAYAVQNEENVSNVRLLDEIGRSISHLRPVPADFLKKNFSYDNFNDMWPDDFLVLASRYSLSTYLAVKLAMPNTESRCKSGHSYLYHAFDGKSSKGIISNHNVDLLLQYSNRANINREWISALNYIFKRNDTYITQQTKALTWINIFKLFLEYGADPELRARLSVKGDSDIQMSALGILDQISEKHPTAAAEVYRIIDRRRRFLYRMGLLRPKKTPDPSKWRFRKDPE